MAQSADWLRPVSVPVRVVNRLFTVCAGTLAIFILCVVLYDVTMRYVFSRPTIWGIDFASFALSYLFFMALAPALDSGFHVSVDYFNHRLGARFQRWAAVLAALLAIVFAAILFWELLDATIEEFVENNLTPTAVPIRVKWLFLIGPIGGAQMLLTACVVALETICGIAPATPTADGRLEP